jgi:hypothetical protein
MIAATGFIEMAAHEWQHDYPSALPASFLMSCAKFVAASFAKISDDGFEALIAEMRIEREKRR